MSVFLSSRRRHTRWPRDWSSDVCSSDLVNAQMRYQLGPKLGVTGAFGMYHQTLPGYILSQNDQFKKLPDTRVRSEERRVGQESGCGWFWVSGERMACSDGHAGRTAQVAD